MIFPKGARSVDTCTSLSDAVKTLYGCDRTIVSRRSVSGGDINTAIALTLDDGTVIFMKSNTPSSEKMFLAEADGLEAIRATGAISVPKVLALGTDKGFSFLLLEYIHPGKQINDFWETFAIELSQMHKFPVGMKYGFESDNWIGAGKQRNTENDSWISFFRDCRLRPQFEAAKHYFSSSDYRRAESLLSHLDQYLIEPDAPSLIHGDLWAGNMITGNDGKGWLIDPAVYHGCAESDIAMTELFGGFSRQFYKCYQDVGLLQPGYEDRRDLYNLYHLLNHLNLFGSSYLGSVVRIIRRYTAVFPQF